MLRSIWFYRRLNLTVILGVALSTAILLGAMIIGDSVRFSLQQLTYARLGRTSQVITAGERLFSKRLSEDISRNSGLRTTALLRSNGVGIINGGKSQFNQLAVWGVDSALSYFAGVPGLFDLQGSEAAINENFARLADLKSGDELTIRVKKLNAFPANTPFVSASETSVSFRITVKKILKSNELGNFNLQNIQTSPRNIFLNLTWLNEQMGLQQKANVVLVNEGAEDKNFSQIIQQSWKLEDLNLFIRENPVLNYTELLSDRVFIEPTIEKFCSTAVKGSHPVFTYFVNNFQSKGKSSPYSFVSTCDTLSGRQILVNDWLAKDLGLQLKDSISLSYFEVGPLRELKQKETLFKVNNIARMEGAFADPNLMPVIPGLSDAGNCRDWKAGIPVDLKKIRPKDEDYWKQFKGTPKAFVSIETARELWGNRFGQSTAIRLKGSQKIEFEQVILKGIEPGKVGFEIKNSRKEGLAAAANGVDFGQLFIGLSFFVLIAAFLLIHLLLRLYIGYRKNEISTLKALGFTNNKIKRLFLVEGSVLALVGILIGIPLSIGYNYLILKAINTIWVDIVRTSIASIYVSFTTVSLGVIIISAIAFLLIYFLLNSTFKVRAQKAKQTKFLKNRYYRLLLTGIVLIMISTIILLISGLNKGEVNPELFYICGFGLLPGILLLLNFGLKKIAIMEMKVSFSFRSYFLKRLSGERKRNMMAISFLAIGIFLVVSTGLFRKESQGGLNLPSSGSGGYNYYIETTLPILTDPSSPQMREDLGLPKDAEIVSFHVQPGDDASCLNLNRITRPRIIACNPALFDQRSSFTFTSGTKDLDPAHPWLALTRKLPDGVIPAFADQTVIQWSLGKKIGDTLIYKNEAGALLRLRLTGGLENSIFQGNIIIAEDNFFKAFPSVSGANLFLVQAQLNPAAKKEFEEGWRHYGAGISGTRERLDSFNSIENTYLNIFLMLGTLGLLIGTIGLGILIFRITLEQIPEYALLLSVGFRKSRILRMLLTEKLTLIAGSVLAGMLPAAVSALPILISSQHNSLWIWLPAIAFLVILSGLLCSFFSIRLALKQNLIASLRGE
ncbi:MAG: ABC transporter permease [Prolixibacteraceae bacterium]